MHKSFIRSALAIGFVSKLSSTYTSMTDFSPSATKKQTNKRIWYKRMTMYLDGQVISDSESCRLSVVTLLLGAIGTDCTHREFLCKKTATS